MRLKPSRSFTALVVLVLWTVGCAPGGVPEPPRGEAEWRAPDGTPVVLISVDTLRSDHLPAYGYDGVATPAIDSLRRDGILFERAYTHVPLTLPAHTSLLTGVLPPIHGVRDNLGYTVDPSRAPLLQQTLKEAGYATGAGVSAFVLRSATGVGAGFDLYDDNIEFAAGSGQAGVQTIQRPGAETLDAIRPWLGSVADRPFFLFLHIFEPHTPYEPPAEYAARYPSAYDGEVAAADDVVGDLLDELRSLGVYENALIVFLSDHGEGLGDHGEDEHGLFLYRSTLQVPLIIKLPESERAGEAVSEPVQLIDVYSTLVTALGLPRGQDLQGQSLLTRSRPDAGDYPIYSETVFPRLHFGWSDLAAVIVGRHHFIEAPQPELYDLVEDPDETSNLVDSEPALQSELRATLSAFDSELAAPAVTDEETRQRLAALGYVGGAVVTDEDDLPDPKEEVETLKDIQSAYRMYARGDLEAAVTAYQQIVEENPKIEDAWEYLALSQIGLGRPEAAAATYQAALEQIPDSKMLSMRAALLFERLGRLDDAFVYANIAIPYNPPAAHLLLAQIAFKRGDYEGAELEAREAMSGGRRQAGPWLVLADISIARGEPNEAIDVLTQALDEGVTDHSLHAKLAITYIWIGQFDQAGEVLQGFEDTDELSMLLAFGRLALSREQWGDARGWFERALIVDPDNPTIKLNLGFVAVAEGRLADAQKLLEDGLSGNPRSFEGWDTLGMVFARQGDAYGAIAAWEKAREINPAVIGVVYNLGLGYAQAGQLERAIAHFEEYAARAEPGPQRDQALALIERLQRRVSQSR